MAALDLRLGLSNPRQTLACVTGYYPLTPGSLLARLAPGLSLAPVGARFRSRPRRRCASSARRGHTLVDQPAPSKCPRWAMTFATDEAPKPTLTVVKGDKP
jgi:hypothetical protein